MGKKRLGIIGLSVILFCLLASLGLIYINNKVKDVKPAGVSVSNITDSGATITWVTDRKTEGKVYFRQKDKGFWANLPVLSVIGRNANYDDRDVDQDKNGDWVLKDEKNGSKERLTHSVTLRDLKPETEYEFRLGVSLGTLNKDANGKALPSFKTMKVSEDLSTPDPVYSKVLNLDRAKADPVDGVVYYQLSNPGQLQVVSALYSTTLNSGSAWAGDIAGIMTSNGLKFVIGDTTTINISARTEIGKASASYLLTDYKPLPNLFVDSGNQIAVSEIKLDQRATWGLSVIRSVKADEKCGTSGCEAGGNCYSPGYVAENTSESTGDAIGTYVCGTDGNWVFASSETKQASKNTGDEGMPEMCTGEVRDCEDNYVESCQVNATTLGHRICHKKGKSVCAVKGTSCSWGDGSYCDDCIADDRKVSEKATTVMQETGIVAVGASTGQGDTSKLVGIKNCTTKKDLIGFAKCDSTIYYPLDGYVCDEDKNLVKLSNPKQDPDGQVYCGAVNLPLESDLREVQDKYECQNSCMPAALVTETTDIDIPAGSCLIKDTTDPRGSQCNGKVMPFGDLICYKKGIFGRITVKENINGIETCTQFAGGTSAIDGYTQYADQYDCPSDCSLAVPKSSSSQSKCTLGGIEYSTTCYFFEIGQIRLFGKGSNGQCIGDDSPLGESGSPNPNFKNADHIEKIDNQYKWVGEAKNKDDCLYNSSSVVWPNLLGKVRAQTTTTAAAKTELSVDTSGNYSVTAGASGQKVSSFAVNTDGKKVQIKMYIDANANGKKDKDETVLTDYSQISLKKDSDTATYDLNTGWNLIALPISSSKGIDTASELLTEFNKQGANIKHIARYTVSGFQMYTKREGDQEYSNDFDLIPGEGYFILNYTAASVHIDGNKFDEAVPFKVQNGWNLVGVYTNEKTYTAEKLLKDMNTSNIAANTVSMYDSGLYKNVVFEQSVLYGNDFGINERQGYFIRVTKGGGDNVKFTPTP